MAIDFVKIQNFKSIQTVDLPLKPINILIGSNGSGKSNFISFFEFLNAIYNQKLQDYVGLRGGTDRFLYHGNNASQIQFEVSFDNQKNGYAATLEDGEYNFIFTKEFLIDKDDKGNNIGNAATESHLKTKDSFKANEIRNYLRSYRNYHFHETGEKSPFSGMSHVENDSYFLYPKGHNLAAYLYEIQKNHLKIYNRIVKTIQSIAPFFLDFYLEPTYTNYIRLQWQSKHSDFIYGVNDLSDGTIRFIALATLFLQPNLPSSIIIDEPELGLHPVAIAKLAGMVKSAAARGTQVIMATQSVDLINHFEAEDIVTVDQINGASQLKRLSEQDLSVWLEEYNIGDLWQRNILIGGFNN